MPVRRVLVTGANKGIGLAVVEALLRADPDNFVILGYRDAARGSAALGRLHADGYPDHKGRLEGLQLDVTDEASVRRAAEDVARMFGADPPPLYAVVNNAGGFDATDSGRTVDLNLRGPHRVFDAFLPLIDTTGGRVVNVSSGAAPMFVGQCAPERRQVFTDPQVTPEQINALVDEFLSIPAGDAEAYTAKGFASDGMGAYGFSKACLSALTVWLARQHPNLRINACTPGFIKTDLTGPMAERQGKTPEELGMKDPADGARPILHLLFAELEGNGRYYGSDCQRSPLDRYRRPGDPPFDGP